MDENLIFLNTHAFQQKYGAHFKGKIGNLSGKILTFLNDKGQKRKKY